MSGACGCGSAASADVQRRYPDDISVRIVEKLPFALWQSPDGIAVVERSGKVITTQNVEAFSRLPKLVGTGAPDAAAAKTTGLSPNVY